MEAVVRTNFSPEITTIFAVEAKYFLFTIASCICCVFLLINGTILFILRNKPIFWECPRYVLLFNLVISDTVIMASGQVMSVIPVMDIRIAYPPCIFLNMLVFPITQIGPLTLSVMSMERYVAVCFPFRHPTIVTLKHTGVAIALIWACSLVDAVFRVALLMEFPFRDLPSLQMKQYCTMEVIDMGPRSKVYDQASTAVLFTFSGLITVCSFLGVTVVARSASSDTSSAVKSRNTLLLHLFQLGLSLLSIMHVPIFLAAWTFHDPGISGKLAKVVYIFVILVPRCLSALTYGLKDHRLRPELVLRLCWCIRIPSVRVQVTSPQTVKVIPVKTTPA